MHFDTASLNVNETYRLLSSAVVPRPIAWLTSLNANGTVNLAPFSFFNAVSSEPPMIAVSIEDRALGMNKVGMNKGSVDKDSLANIKRTGSFVSHIVTEIFVQAVVMSAIEFPSEISEAEVVGLKLVSSHHIAAPRLQGAPVSMECQLETLLRVGTAATLVIAKVVCFHVQDELYENGRINSTKLQALGRMSGSYFTKTRELISIPTPTYDTWLQETAKAEAGFLGKQETDEPQQEF
jgi:flavin reductase (DIM6/NTAB) family NADH-FMN oxidoreductase RutF